MSRKNCQLIILTNLPAINISLTIYMKNTSDFYEDFGIQRRVNFKRFTNRMKIY